MRVLDTVVQESCVQHLPASECETCLYGVQLPVGGRQVLELAVEDRSLAQVRGMDHSLVHPRI